MSSTYNFNYLKSKWLLSGLGVFAGQIVGSEFKAQHTHKS